MRHSRTPRIYSPRSYQNPFFGRRRKKIRRFSLKTKLIAIAALILAGALAWALFFNAYFSIDNVIVKGAELIDEHKIYSIIDKQLQNKRLFVFAQKNIFAFSKRQVKNEFLKNFNVADLRVNKDLPRTLTVSFAEKTPSAVWSENDQYYYIDADFTVLAEVEALSLDAQQFIVLKNENSAQPLIRLSGLTKKVSLDKTYLFFCLNLAKKTGEQGIATDSVFLINEQEKTIRIHLTDGPQVYFNVENDLNAQFEKLTVLLTEKFNPNDLKKLDYIDLRFGDKIYYK
jgi:hypothetical protein